MTEWCQNKDCCYKKNQNQIRGSKGNKYYQSNKVSKRLKHWCCNGCREQWWQQHGGICMNTIGTIGKKTIGVDDAWGFRSEWNSGGSNSYFLINLLMGVKHRITREQAQTPEDIRENYGWGTRPGSEAKPLAIQLGLTS